jgi:phosphatidylserine decarboxylase
METIDKFLKRDDVKKRYGKSIADILENVLNRDPSRPIYVDKTALYSPADGFVLYSKVVKPDEEILPVKGGTYSVNTLTRKEIKGKCLVIGIYMTVIDVHIQRAPSNGIYTYERMPNLKVTNLSMRPLETALLEQMKINVNEMQYAFYNERMLYTVRMAALNLDYHILLTGDFEVDVIAPFRVSGATFTQCERISLVRMGSQCDLIIPLDNPKLKIDCLIPEDGTTYHVEAGVDQLVKIKRK